jgi:concanavalin A-like lectin/glucanase superfamily protein
VVKRAGRQSCVVAALFAVWPIGCGDVVVPIIGRVPSDVSSDASTQNDFDVSSDRVGPVDAKAPDLGSSDGPTEAGTLPDATGGQDPNLVGYWNFDEGTGVIAVDSSGHGNNGSLQGGATWGPGKVGSHCLALNAAGAFVDIPNAVVDTRMPYSVSAWVNLTTAAGNQAVVSIDGNSDSAFFFKQHSAGFFTLEVRASDTASAPVAASAPASTQTAAATWYYFTGVFDGSRIYLYVGGALNGSGIFTTPWTGNGHTSFGRSKFMGQYGDYVTGAIDEVRIYSRALTAPEVQALYLLQ